MAKVLAFTIIIKVALAVVIIIFIVAWRRDTKVFGNGTNQYNTTRIILTQWMTPTAWILELIDNL